MDPRDEAVEQVRRQVAEAVDAPGLRVTEALRRGERSDVWRMADAERSYVVKHYLEPATGTWRREYAGLRTAAGADAPTAYAVNADAAFVVMADLGAGRSLADLVLDLDAGAAAAGVRRWAQAIARLHLASEDRRAEFDATLQSLGATDDAAPDFVSDERGLTQLAATTAGAGLPEPDDVAAAYATLTAPLTDPATWLLSPGDACPDNNLDDGRRLQLLDFEFAEYRHPAWDLAYLRVPWPSCWCAWALPVEVADRAAADYRAAVAGRLAWVEGDVDDLVTRAAVAFSLISCGWFLPRALEPEGDEPTEQRPGRRAMILHRLGLVARATVDTDLTAYAADLRSALADRWGDHELALAPAFR